MHIIKMEEETPHWENNGKVNSKYLSQYVGHNCNISLKNGITLPSLYKYLTTSVDVFIQDYDIYFLHITYTVKKTKYKGIIDINNVISIAMAEEG